MDIIKILAVGLVTVVASQIVKTVKPEMSVFVSLAGGIIILSMTINYCLDVVSVISGLVQKTGISSEILKSVLKIIGVAYLTEFSASMCNDAGNTSVGDKILFAGKMIILVMALPIVNGIINIIISILP